MIRRTNRTLASELSKTQIDKLGERLKRANISEDDLRMLDEYRRSFAAQYDYVVDKIQTELSAEPTGRPAKSTTSISEKLLRESIRLTQIQDIAGCRIVVPDILRQDEVVTALKASFDTTTVVDRRVRPSHHYRAVHVIIKYGGKSVEVQVRSLLQHKWAEQSEKISDVLDPNVKYGAGNATVQELLQVSSEAIAKLESQQVTLSETKRHLERLLQLSAGEITDEITKLQQSVTQLEADLKSLTHKELELLQTTIDALKEYDVISD